MQIESGTLSAKPRTILKRWGFTWREVAVLLVWVYFTLTGGTRASTFHFPLAMLCRPLVMVLLVSPRASRLLQRGRSRKTIAGSPVAYRVSAEDIFQSNAHRSNLNVATDMGFPRSCERSQATSGILCDRTEPATG